MSEDEKRMIHSTPPTYEEVKAELLLKQIGKDLSNISVEMSTIRNDISQVKIDMMKNIIELDNIKKSGESRESILNKIHDAIYDPEKGIYASIKDTDNNFLQLNSRLVALEGKLDLAKKELQDEIEKTESSLTIMIGKEDDQIKTNFQISQSRLDPLFDDHEALIAIGGDKQLTNIKNAIDSHKNMSKLWWALILAVISGFGKVAWDIIMSLN